MLFNSFEFALFFPLVFVLYWALQRKPLVRQNAFLLVASYIFYGWWDWRFLSLIVISSTVDYLVGMALSCAQGDQKRKFLLMLSVCVNIGILGAFKYYNFFVDSFENVIQTFGTQVNIETIQIILPVGISFYTFQTLSYTIDIYRGEMVPTRNIIAFFAYVSFFPQLVAGPIERAQNLLPQFLRKRCFDSERAKDGLRQILWGLLKKIVIADNLSQYVDTIYSNYSGFNGPTLLVGTFFFAIQIYCDFSGYSDIAIGTARLLGFNLMRNFAYPYFSRDVGEFWRRWHISLSTWFRDYVFIPLGGSRTAKKTAHLRNIMITFTLSGLWHGASWNFVIWGFLHSVFYLPLVIFGQHKRYKDSVNKRWFLPSPKEVFQIGLTFTLVLFAWIFFRADTVGHALSFIARMLTSRWIILPLYKKALLYVCVFLGIEWIQRDKPHALQIETFPVVLRWSIYYAMTLFIFFFRATEYEPFIYFQF